MSALKHHYFDTWATPGAIEHTDRAVREADVGSGPALRYSSPWPWVLALTISSSMWVGIGWLIWKLV